MRRGVAPDRAAAIACFSPPPEVADPRRGEGGEGRRVDTPEVVPHGGLEADGLGACLGEQLRLDGRWDADLAEEVAEQSEMVRLRQGDQGSGVARDAHDVPVPMASMSERNSASRSAGGMLKAETA